MGACPHCATLTTMRATTIARLPRGERKNIGDDRFRPQAANSCADRLRTLDSVLPAKAGAGDIRFEVGGYNSVDLAWASV